MLFDPIYTVRPTANQTDVLRPPTVFVVLRNGETTALAAGYAVCYDTDGLTAKKPTTAMLNCFAGIAAEAISAFDDPTYYYGLVQVYGYTATCLTLAEESTAAAGDSLVPTNAQWYMTTKTAANTGLNMGFAQSLEAYTNTVTAANKKALIRAL